MCVYEGGWVQGWVCVLCTCVRECVCMCVLCICVSMCVRMCMHMLKLTLLCFDQTQWQRKAATNHVQGDHLLQQLGPLLSVMQLVVQAQGCWQLHCLHSQGNTGQWTGIHMGQITVPTVCPASEQSNAVKATMDNGQGYSLSLQPDQHQNRATQWLQHWTMNMDTCRPHHCRYSLTTTEQSDTVTTTLDNVHGYM